eukprot:3789526-Pyramimonas_sp.AAC.1
MTQLTARIRLTRMSPPPGTATCHLPPPPATCHLPPATCHLPPATNMAGAAHICREHRALDPS